MQGQPKTNTQKQPPSNRERARREGGERVGEPKSMFRVSQFVGPDGICQELWRGEGEGY